MTRPRALIPDATPRLDRELVALAEAQGGVLKANDYYERYKEAKAASAMDLINAIAARHGITRSANRAVLNVAVVRGPRAAESVPVTARIDATARNASDEVQPLHLREVREGGAIYYLGEARIEESDTLDFDLRVHPEAGRTITLRYRQTFWPQGPEARL